MADNNNRIDPYRGFNFRLEIDNIQKGAFRECSGLDASTDSVEYRAGSDKGNTTRKLPGLNKFANITLKWGAVDDHTAWDWRKQVMEGKVERKHISIILMDESGGDKIRWNLVNAWPTKWIGPALNATSSEVAVESLEFVHEGCERA